MSTVQFRLSVGDAYKYLIEYLFTHKKIELKSLKEPSSVTVRFGLLKLMEAKIYLSPIEERSALRFEFSTNGYYMFGLIIAIICFLISLMMPLMMRDFMMESLVKGPVDISKLPMWGQLTEMLWITSLLIGVILSTCIILFTVSSINRTKEKLIEELAFYLRGF